QEGGPPHQVDGREAQEHHSHPIRRSALLVHGEHSCSGPGTFERTRFTKTNGPGILTMRGWDLGIELDARSQLPLFLQIARAVADGVRSGRLRPGEPLPGSRTLATTLRIHRNTALAAYRELEAEGWIVTSAARGTFVSS